MRRFVENHFPKLLDLLYDAALDPLRWQTFLDALSQNFGGSTGVLHLFDAATQSVPSFATFGHDPAYIASYAAHYAGVNPYPNIAFHKLPIGKTLYASDYLLPETVEVTEFFNDWMKPQGITSDHLALSLRNDGHGAAVLGVAPHASVYSKGRKRYAAQLQLLAPHMVRAVEINRVTSAARLAERSLGGTLEALGAAAFLVGRSGRLLIANNTAEELMRGERLVSVDRFKILRAANANDDKALSLAIAAAAAAPSEGSRQPLRLTSRGSGRAYVAWVLPVRPPRDGAPSRRFELFSGVGAEPMVLLLLAPAENGVAVPPGAIQAVFGLSPAEARLASALTTGCTVAEYAAAAGISRNTARNQLTSVFAKTATTRQTQLVALIVGALGPAAGRANVSQ